MDIKTLFQRWHFRKDQRKVLYQYESVIRVSSISEIPSGDLIKNIFLVQRDGINRWVVFDCPGGHKKRIEVNLMESHTPFWKVKIHKGKISLNPSVAVDNTFCDCHFWLEKNIVYKAYFYY